MKLDSSWRPKDWKNPHPKTQQAPSLRPALHRAFEEGASAIIPAVEEATLKAIGEWLQDFEPAEENERFWNGVGMLKQGKMPEEVKHD